MTMMRTRRAYKRTITILAALLVLSVVINIFLLIKVSKAGINAEPVETPQDSASPDISNEPAQSFDQTVKPTEALSASPAVTPTVAPTTKPTETPAATPKATTRPTPTATVKPTVRPTKKPAKTPEPTPTPYYEPTNTPGGLFGTSTPTPAETVQPTPSALPTAEATPTLEQSPDIFG